MLRMEALMDDLGERQRIVVVAGARIIAAAGIPTFAQQEGDRHSDPWDFDASVFAHPRRMACLFDRLRVLRSRVEDAPQATQFHLLLSRWASAYIEQLPRQ